MQRSIQNPLSDRPQWKVDTDGEPQVFEYYLSTLCLSNTKLKFYNNRNNALQKKIYIIAKAKPVDGQIEMTGSIKGREL